METIPPEIACCILDGLDGTTAVAKLLKLPTSTVHSWRRIGMTASRADHLRLAAAGAGRSIDFATGIHLIRPMIEGLIDGNEREWQLAVDHRTAVEFTIEEAA